MSWGVRKFSGGRQCYRTDRWQRLRRKVLSEQPLCAMREQRERCRLVATEVDHIKPHRGDRRLFFDRANLRRCAGAATRKRLRGRFSARDEERTNTACRSIPTTTGTRTERSHRLATENGNCAKGGGGMPQATNNWRLCTRRVLNRRAPGRGANLRLAPLRIPSL